MARKGKIKNKQLKDEIERPVRFKKYKYLFLIVCEDQKTEPAYFRQFTSEFPPETLYLRSTGTGLDPKGVTERAVIEREQLELEAKKEVDCTWVIFDIDDAAMNATRFQRFKDAFALAVASDFHVGWSNEAFELWLLLHLTDIADKPARSRHEVFARLQEEIRKHAVHSHFTYKHGSGEILAVIASIGNEARAIERAKALALAHANREPINANPCTSVHLLVNDLREWIKYFNQPSDC